MTVPQQTPVSNAWGNNSATEFPFDFYIEKASELVVEHTDLNGIKTTLENGVDYSIHEVGNTAGSYVTFPLAGSRYSTLAWDLSTDKKELLTMSLNLPIEQSAEFKDSGDLSKKNLELSFDYAIRLIQILNRTLSRAVKVNEGDEVTPDQLIASLNESKQVAVNAATLATTKADEAQNSANIAKENADIATSKTQEVTETYNNAMADIQKDWQDAIDAIEEKQTTAESSITNLQTIAESTITSGIADITLNKEQSMSAIDENRTTSVEEILANKTSSMAAIDKNRTDSLSEIESAKTSALENITTTESSAISNLEQTGTGEYNKIISTGIDAKLSKNMITNCLTGVPQRIKLALEDGKMHLCKGSVLTYGDGSNLTIEEDVIEDQLVNTTHDGLMLVYDAQRTDNKLGIYIQDGNVFCQDTQPTTTIAHSIWFDTANNKMKQTHDTGATWYEIPLPIGIVSVTPNVWKSLDRVFNGMGYVGNTFWVDKGVKGLIPNGRNADGTLKNVEYETPFLMRTMNRDGDWELIYDPIGTDYNFKLRTFGNDVYLDKHTNQWVNLGTGIMQTKLYTNLASVQMSSGSVTKFSPREPFEASNIWSTRYESSTQTLYLG